MVTPPGIPKISVRTPTSPAPKLSLTKPIVTEEFGKPTTSAPPVSSILAASASEAITQDMDQSKSGSPTYDKATLVTTKAKTVVPGYMETSSKASFDAMIEPVDRGRIERANAGAATGSLLKAPEQHLQGGNTALNPGA